jgi:hypothetical protein
MLACRQTLEPVRGWRAPARPSLAPRLWILHEPAKAMLGGKSRMSRQGITRH